MSCQGKPIEMQDLRTQEQKDMMKAMFPLLLSGIQRGATPFGGQLSQAPDPSMLMAMNTMTQQGGYGPYSFPGFQAGGYAQPGQGIPGGFGGGGNYGGGGYTNPGDEDPYGNRFTNFPLPDPYAPWRNPLPPGRWDLPPGGTIPKP